MPLFRYRALGPDGSQQQGEIEVADRAAAIQALRQRGLIPIEAQPMAARSARKPLLGGSVPARELTAFTRELAVLTAGGQPLDWSLEMLADGGGFRRLTPVIKGLRERVRGGASLADAMAERGNVFPRLDVAMVRAGEATGKLGEALGQLASLRESSEALRRKLVSALLYPAILAVVAVGSLLLLLGFVVPQFEPLFEDAGQALPASTQVVILLARALREHGLTMLIVVLALILVASQLLRRPGPRVAFDGFLLRLPLLGPLAKERTTAEIGRGLGTLLGAGLDLPQALVLVREMVHNRAAAASLDAVILGVRQGRPLWRCVEETGRLVPTAVRMLRVGEETGRLAQSARFIADTYEERASTKLARLTALAEPVLVITLGLMVGGIVMSILTAVLAVNELAS
jgi:general secretion pathway protein F